MLFSQNIPPRLLPQSLKARCALTGVQSSAVRAISHLSSGARGLQSFPLQVPKSTILPQIHGQDQVNLLPTPII